MTTRTPLFATPRAYLTADRPDAPVHFFAPAALGAQAARFRAGFPGLVTYAVKANPDAAVLAKLMASGIRAFDVASPNEIASVRALLPDATLHYNNPVRSRDEIAFAIAAGVRSFSCDCVEELEKLAALLDACGNVEVSVRFRLPVKGAAYDFGAKFGAEPDAAAHLMQRAAALGFTVSLTFHPGTQCTDPAAFEAYIRAAGEISRRAGIAPARLNVGGGFPSGRSGILPDLEAFFATISRAVADAFPRTPPALVCEPGRAMVADAFALAVRIKGVRGDGRVYLNDGIYGGLSEFPIMGLSAVSVMAPDGRSRRAQAVPRTLFGPTCDSLDVLPGPVDLPEDLAEGDYLIFRAMGAYVTGVSTRFNGYGEWQTVLVRSVDGAESHAAASLKNGTHA